MTLQAIRVDSQKSRDPVYRCELGPNVCVALLSAKGNGSPAILIAREGDAHTIERCDYPVEHVFKKAKKALGPLITGKTAIVIVRGEYKAYEKVVQSARMALKHAHAKRDKNIYLILVSAEIFAAIWRQAIAQPVKPVLPEVVPGKVDEARTMFELLPDIEIPDQLVRDFIGDSVEVRLVRRLVVQASGHDEPVLIEGDSGTGKEVVARLIHDLSPRRAGTFMRVDCGAIPRDLFEAELFGVEKGAHNAAYFDRPGLWRIADGGTLFLDEIADLALEHQIKILRALDQGEILPLGALKPVRVNARIVAATNKDLFAMVRAGQFREDLYYRLRGMFIRTPPLRSHPNDIPALAQALWKKATSNPGSELAPDVIAVLRGRLWPGNVRELKTCLATVFNLFGPKDIQVNHLNAVFGFERSTPSTDADKDALEDDVVFRLQCLRHLRHTDEVLRAVQVPMREVNKGRQRTPENFRSIAVGTEGRVNEFEVLCARPVLFHHSIPMFNRIRRLKEKLRSFAELMRDDPDAALKYWKDLEPEFADALAAVFEEVKRVLRELARHSNRQH
ncbi:MAG: sigma 54-interacting transcriptional regulator [Longimicrobiales bacterium]